MQEDKKKGLFDALDTRLDCLHMAARWCWTRYSGETPTLSGRGATGYASATELADYWSRKACRSAKRHIVGEAVVEAIRGVSPLESVTAGRFTEIQPRDWRRCVSDIVFAVVSG